MSARATRSHTAHDHPDRLVRMAWSHRDHVGEVQGSTVAPWDPMAVHAVRLDSGPRHLIVFFSPEPRDEPVERIVAIFDLDLYLLTFQVWSRRQILLNDQGLRAVVRGERPEHLHLDPQDLRHASEPISLYLKGPGRNEP